MVEYLDIIDENNEVIGKSEFIEAHKKGLRHRSVQIFVFKDKNLEDLLVSQRSKSKSGAELFGPSAAGHVKSGQTYLESARAEFREELFANKELPEDMEFVEICKFVNNTTYKVHDSNAINREISCLFGVIYPGPFTIDNDELRKVSWERIPNIFESVYKNPERYTPAFVNALEQTKGWLHESCISR